MARELLVLRHAMAAGPAGFLTDGERPLEPAGERDAERIGRWLGAAGALPDLTLASPALRARATAELVLQAAGVNADLTLEPRIYEASLATLRELVAMHDAAPSRLLLVGHNPGLEALVLHLTGGIVPLASGTLARLEMPARWAGAPPGCARLRARVTPEEVSDQIPGEGDRR